MQDTDNTKRVPFAFPPSTWENIRKGHRNFEQIIFGLLILCEVSEDEEHFKTAEKVVSESPEQIHIQSGAPSIPGHNIYTRQIWNQIKHFRENKDDNPSYWVQLIDYLGHDYTIRISLIRNLIRLCADKIEVDPINQLATNIEGKLISISPWSDKTWTRAILRYRGSEITYRRIHGPGNNASIGKTKGDGTYYIISGTGIKKIICKV